AQIAELIPPEVRRSVRVDRDFHTPQQLLELLGGFDLVVATRMHMAILALVAGTPVLPVAYEFKTAELFASLGLRDWVQDFQSLNAREFSDTVSRFVDELPALQASIERGVAAQRASAQTAPHLIAQALVGRPGQPVERRYRIAHAVLKLAAAPL